MTTVTTALHIVALTNKGVGCVTNSSTGSVFWLPRDRYVTWTRPPAPGVFVPAVLPQWRQLAEVASQRVTPRNSNAKGSNQMADQNNEGRGALFRETSKKSEKSPDMTGHLTIDGIRYRLAGWTREGKDGRKFLSVAAELPKEHRADAKPRPAAPVMARDEIPFAPEVR